MTENRNVTTQPGRAETQADPARQVVLMPPVDVLEDAEGITLIADLPGVNKEGLSVRVNANTLTIEGEARIEMPAELAPLYVEVRSVRYQRSFTLNRDLDTNKIEAELKHGVLKLFLPKHDATKPRRIEIRAG